MRTNIKNTLVLLALIIGLRADAQSQFTNCGNFIIHSGVAVTFYGDLINNKTFVDSGTGITMAGTAAQQIGGTAFCIFKNLTLNNSSGAYLGVGEYLTGVLTITSGTFTTTGYNFTLLSTANGTASIAPILGNFAGNITMQRYLPKGSTSWRFLASPVTGATIGSWQKSFPTSGFHGSTAPNSSFVSIYTYNESTPGVDSYGYVGATDTCNPLTPGIGFWCYVGPVPLTFAVTGPPVKFTHTFPVTYTQSAGPTNDGWNMVGNPYPSAIDWNSTAWTKTNVNNAIYIWNDSLQQYSSWVSGVSVNKGTSVIASSQSFWVQTNAASPSLISTENVKVTANPTFLKPFNTQAFDVLKFSFKGNGYTDESIIRFGNGATNGYDAEFDARKIYSSNSQVPGMASQDSTGKDMSINSLPALTGNIDIPIKTLVGVTGIYTLVLDSSSNVPSGYCLVLEDKATGFQFNINNFTAYTFSISDTTKAARFVLHIASCGALTGYNQLADEYKLTAYPNPTKGLVNINYDVNASTDGKPVLQVVDLGTGQVVEEKELQNNTSYMQLDMSRYADGVYSVSIQGAAKASEHVKVVKMR